MTQGNDSARRIEKSIRAAMLAKEVLGLVGMSPSVARLQMMEIGNQFHALREFISQGEK